MVRSNLSTTPLGEEDVIVIFDLPDNASAAALAFSVSATGLVRTKTTPLLTIEETDQALGKGVELPGSRSIVVAPQAFWGAGAGSHDQCSRDRGLGRANAEPTVKSDHELTAGWRRVFTLRAAGIAP